MRPFTIILKNRADGEVQDVEIKVDPGGKTTGVELVGHFEQRGAVVCGARTSSIAAKPSREALNRVARFDAGYAGARPATGKPGS